MPEPEAMDLPDDLQLDDGEEKEEAPEENPFDIDTMKEQMPPPLEDKGEEKESDNEEPEKDQMNDSSDEEELEELKLSLEDENDEKPDENPENKNLDNLEKKPEDAEEESKDDTENSSALDNQTSEEHKVQPMEVDNIDKSDNVETNPNQNQNNQSNQASQEESIEKDGVGQTQMEESETGHKGQANAKTDSLNSQNEKEPLEKRQRPGESDINRSLGEMSEPIRKKLKTINIHDGEEEESNANDEGAEMDKDAETYQHIKEARESDAQVLDAATKDQAEMQKLQELENEKNDDEANDVEMDADEVDPEINDVSKQKPEKTESKHNKKKTDGKSGEFVEEIKDAEVEGDVVETMHVSRGTDSSYHTQYDVVNSYEVARLNSTQIQDLRTELESQLGKWNEVSTVYVSFFWDD